MVNSKVVIINWKEVIPGPANECSRQNRKKQNYGLLEMIVHLGVKFSIFTAEMKNNKLKEMDLRLLGELWYRIGQWFKSVWLKFDNHWDRILKTRERIFILICNGLRRNKKYNKK